MVLGKICRLFPQSVLKTCNPKWTRDPDSLWARRVRWFKTINILHCRQATPCVIFGCLKVQFLLFCVTVDFLPSLSLKWAILIIWFQQFCTCLQGVLRRLNARNCTQVLEGWNIIFFFSSLWSKKESAWSIKQILPQKGRHDWNLRLPIYTHFCRVRQICCFAWREIQTCK